MFLMANFGNEDVLADNQKLEEKKSQVQVQAGEDFLNFIYPFPVQGVPHWRVKSSGVRQSKIYKCPERSFGS